MIITAKQADVTGDGVPDKIILSGEKDQASDIFIKNITLAVEDGRTKRVDTISFSNNAGYNPRLFIGDLNCDGVQDILISIDSGGSGGFGFYYIYSYKNNIFNKLFDNDEFNRMFKYEVMFREGCRVSVYSEYFLRTYLIDVSSRVDFYEEQGVYNRNCKLLKPVEGFVPGLNNLYPQMINNKNCYALLAVQRVIGLFGADTVGYLETVLEWDQTQFTGTNEFVRAAE